MGFPVGHPQELQTMVEILREEFSRLALSTLAASTFLVGSAVYATALDRSFLVTKVQMQGTIEGLTTGEGAVAMVMVDGDVTSAQIAAIFDARVSDNQVQRAADQKTKAVMLLVDDEISTMEVTFGKGVPYEEAKGWQFGVFNFDTASALTTGAIAQGLTKVTGVFL